jgi:predicted transposase YdaD
MSSKISDASSENMPSENPAPGPGPGDDSAAADRGIDRGRGPDLVSTAQHHDALFKTVFGDPAYAAEVLRAILPPQVAAHFEWNIFEADHASVVGEGFEQRHGDLLFRARLVDGRQAFVRLLFEHQSTVDYWMSWRMTRMIYVFLNDAYQRHPEARYLPAVLPVLLYQGSRPWTAPTSLLELTDLSDQARGDLGPYLLSLRYVLDDLRVVEVDDVDARPLSPVPRLTLGLMKHYQSETVIAFLEGHAEDIRVLYATEHGRIWLSRLLRYTWHVNPHAYRKPLIYLVARLVGQDIEQTMLTLDQLLEKATYEKGIEKGIEKGVEKGVEKGQRELLLRLLVRRFGTLPDSVTRRVAGASSEEIERWFDRAVDAASLDDVFAAA